MKYNDNGTYRDLYIKSFDTVPVGSEIDFSGTNIPDGWTEVSDNSITKTYSLADQTVTANSSLLLDTVPSNNGKTYIGCYIKNGNSISGVVSLIVAKGSNNVYLLCTNAQTFSSNAEITITYMYETPKIKKTNQYINGGASLSSVHGTSSNNGYTQEYLNDKLVHVGPEIDDNSKVNFIASKNLYTGTQNLVVGGVNHYPYTSYDLKPNTKYTISFIKSRISGVTISNNTIYDCNIYFYDNSNTQISYITGTTAVLSSGGSKTFTKTFTTPSNTAYVTIRFGNNNGDSNENTSVTNIMINNGEIAQPYETYITPTINIDGEDIYVKGQNEVYSTTEQRIGTWIDGKPVYRRVFNGTTASTAGQIATLGNIANLDTMINIYGSLISSSGYWTNVPMYYVNPNTATTYYCVAQVDPSKNVYVLSSYISTNVKVIVEYTKTTD